MPQYRKRPIIVEAFQYTGKKAPWEQAPKWLWNAILDRRIRVPDRGPDTVQELYVDTLEGKMTVNIGDWIIQGVNGELYPCKPDIFDKTYERVAEVGAPTDA